jgi:hypothetical protein
MSAYRGKQRLISEESPQNKTHGFCLTHAFILNPYAAFWGTPRQIHTFPKNG